VRAFEAGARVSEAWPNAHTVAFGLTVPKPLGDFLVLDALYETGGTAIAVADDLILRDVELTARLEGLFMCPEGAATVTAARLLREQSWIRPDDEVVLLNTGTGLLYPETVRAAVPTVAADQEIVLDAIPN
jgi:threonine synthase